MRRRTLGGHVKTAHVTGLARVVVVGAAVLIEPAVVVVEQLLVDRARGRPRAAVRRHVVAVVATAVAIVRGVGILSARRVVLELAALDGLEGRWHVFLSFTGCPV